MHQHETDAERQHDSSELLLALWSENFKEEFEGQWADALASLRTDVSNLKVGLSAIDLLAANVSSFAEAS